MQDINSLSRAGCSFYRSAVQQADDYNIRRIFQQRFEIHQQLQELVAEHNALDSYSEDPKVIACANWYETAEHSIDGFSNLIFLDLLEQQEAVIMLAMKNQVRNSDSQYLRQQLARVAAHLQISRDALNSLKEQYRLSQTNILPR